MKIQRLDDLALFLTTVDAGSFSAAARQLDVAPAVASAAIKRLEAQLGVRLFERTTRRLRLSEAGERFLPDARQAWQHLRDAEQALDADAHALTGTLRLTLPSTWRAAICSTGWKTIWPSARRCGWKCR
ncbi:LysR family transcriptional regulator [Halopseudomonas pachastrellae]|nr:LysR family transcriptional regulator [Halopseudomonas pachastrellae]